MEFIKQMNGPVEIGATIVGQAQTAGRALDELNAEPAFELCDDGARGPARQTEIGAGSRETAALGHTPEDGHCTKLIHGHITKKDMSNRALSGIFRQSFSFAMVFPVWEAV